jgi:hypothetical protein
MNSLCFATLILIRFRQRITCGSEIREMEIWWVEDQVKLMELLLNLAWLAIAVGSYAIVGWRLACARSTKASGPNRLQCIVALSCSLAILFPVISLTDDLHEMQATLEEASSTRLVIKQCGVSHSLTSARALHSTYCVAPPFATVVSWTVLGRVATQEVSRPAAGNRVSTPIRAPPFLMATQAS